MLPAIRGGGRGYAHGEASSAQLDLFGQLESELKHYINIPNEIKNYEELSAHHLFSEIKSQFLEDISKFKELVMFYVQQTYSEAIEVFMAKVRDPEENIFKPLYLIYLDTRYQIHILCSFFQKRKEYSDLECKVISDEAISCLLHECLQGIELCPSGVHSRIYRAYQSLQASTSERAIDKIVNIKVSLLQSCVQSFMLQEKQKSSEFFLEGNEVHVFNGLFNKFCENLGLSKIVDILAPTTFGADFLNKLSATVLLEVSEAKVYKKLAVECLNIFEKYLIKHDKLNWLKDEIKIFDFNYDAMDLNCCFLDRMNVLFNSSKQEALVLPALLNVNYNKDGDEIYDFSCIFEKMLFWILKTYKKGKESVLFCKPKENRVYEIIGSMDDIFFWVYDSLNEISPGMPCTIQEDQYRSLTLSHLSQISFAHLDSCLCFELLSQAIQQTDCCKEIVDFFCNDAIAKDMSRKNRQFKSNISLLFRERMVGNEVFEDQIKKAVLERLELEKRVHSSKIEWLLKTKILEEILCVLSSKNIDIRGVIKILTISDIMDFSKDGLALLDYQHLYEFSLYADNNNIMKLLENIILTQKCDQIISELTKRNPKLLMKLILTDHREGAAYLAKIVSQDIIKYKYSRRYTALMCACFKNCKDIVEIIIEKSNINDQDRDGASALMIACENGYKEIVLLLLEREDIDINAKTNAGYTALIYACENGYKEIALLLLEREDIDINARTDDGYTALIYACENGYKEIALLLLEREDIDINARIDAGYTALIYACENGYEEIALLLLEREDIDINARTDAGYTALMLACENGYEEIALLLLEREQLDIDDKTNKGWTALMLACNNGYEKIVLSILKRDKLSINAQDNLGSTALIYACDKGYSNIVLLFLREKSLDINIRNKENRTALMIACESGYEEIALLLLEREDIDINAQDNEGWTALMIACESGYEDIVLSLLKENALDVNAQDDRGWTALMLACKEKHEEIISFLLEREELDVNIKNREGWTALMIACRNNSLSIVNKLISIKKLNVNIKNSGNFSALMIACMQDCENAILSLLEREDIDINAKSDNACTSLMYACDKNYKNAVLSFLKRKDLDINAQDKEGCTALMYACKYNNLELVNSLLKKDGININAKNAKGCTALMYACKYNNASSAHSLLSVEDIDINAQDKEGCTALMYVCNNGFEDIFQLLLSYEGVDFDLYDRLGWTALMFAADQGCENIVHKLLACSSRVDFKNNNGETAAMIASNKGLKNISDYLLNHKHFLEKN